MYHCDQIDHRNSKDLQLSMDRNQAAINKSGGKYEFISREEMRTLSRG